MFFLKSLKIELNLHPKFFGPRIRSKIKDRLKDAVEGKSLGKIGYVVAVDTTAEIKISSGRLEDFTGEVLYEIEYQAIIFRPFKNEVLDGIVTVAVDHGFFCSAGPLEIFVSRHMMPDDITQFNSETHTWVSEDRQVEIRAGCAIRLRIIGVSIDANSISAVGTIKDDYLGLIAKVDTM